MALLVDPCFVSGEGIAMDFFQKKSQRVVVCKSRCRGRR